jgi:hypothetical protein
MRKMAAHPIKSIERKKEREEKIYIYSEQCSTICACIPSVNHILDRLERCVTGASRPPQPVVINTSANISQIYIYIYI